ncbi:hypothetical protein GCM10009616_08120 [Microlunatus lacustris]
MALAQQLEPHLPASMAANTRTSRSGWAPSLDLLDRDIKVRHTWELLDEALDRLDSLYQFPDGLRCQGLLPVVAGRTSSVDYRWRLVHRLNGRPEEQREFWMANYQTAEPGYFNTAELIKADAEAAAAAFGGYRAALKHLGN